MTEPIRGGNLEEVLIIAGEGEEATRISDAETETQELSQELQDAQEVITKIAIESQEKYTAFFEEWDVLKGRSEKPSDNEVVDLINKIDKQLKRIKEDKEIVLSNISEEEETLLFDFIDLSTEDDSNIDENDTPILGNIDTSLSDLKFKVVNSDLTSEAIKALYSSLESEEEHTTGSQGLLDEVDSLLAVEIGLTEGSFFRKQTDNILNKLNSLISNEETPEEDKIKLKDARTKILELKLIFVRKHLSEEFLKTDNTEDLVNNLIDLVTENEALKETLRPMVNVLLTMDQDDATARQQLEDDFNEQIAGAESSEEKEKLKNLKKIASVLGRGGINNFYKEEGASLEAFFKFLMNPNAGTYTENMQGGGSREVLTYNSFQEEIQNSAKVGKALFLLVKNSEIQSVKSWANRKSDELSAIKDGENKQETSKLLVSLYKDVLKGSSSDFNEFIGGFASLLGGKENLHVQDATKEYFKELLKDDGEKLNKVWEIEGGDGDEVVEDNGDE